MGEKKKLRELEVAAYQRSANAGGFEGGKIKSQAKECRQLLEAEEELCLSLQKECTLANIQTLS